MHPFWLSAATVLLKILEGPLHAAGVQIRFPHDEADPASPKNPRIRPKS